MSGMAQCEHGYCPGPDDPCGVCEILKDAYKARDWDGRITNPGRRALARELGGVCLPPVIKGVTVDMRAPYTREQIADAFTAANPLPTRLELRPKTHPSKRGRRLVRVREILATMKQLGLL